MDLAGEVSMIACKFLHNISNADFGKISVVFAGDFSQSPPVGDVRLYAFVQECQYERIYESDEPGASEGARDVALAVDGNCGDSA